MARRSKKKATPLRSLGRKLVWSVAFLVFGLCAWMAYFYFRTPKEDRSLRAAVSEAFQYTENVYSKPPKIAVPLDKLPVVGKSTKTASSQPAPDDEDEGRLDTPILIARVIRVVDGDTLVIESAGKEERLRLLMVNTPESVHPDKKQNVPLGKIASDYTKNRLENRQVRIVHESDSEKRDRFGRLLGYVVIEDVNFNVELVEEGYSPYYTAFGRSKEYDAEFAAAEKRARQAKKGIWADPKMAENYLRLKSKWGQGVSKAERLELEAAEAP